MKMGEWVSECVWVYMKDLGCGLLTIFLPNLNLWWYEWRICDYGSVLRYCRFMLKVKGGKLVWSKIRDPSIKRRPKITLLPSFHIDLCISLILLESLSFQNYFPSFPSANNFIISSCEIGREQSTSYSSKFIRDACFMREENERSLDEKTKQLNFQIIQENISIGFMIPITKIHHSI